MQSLKNIIEEEGTIFQDNEIFTLEYVPDEYEYRDSQLKTMAIHSTSIKRGVRPSTFLLRGGCATGKTTAMIKFFEELESYFPNVVTAHVNCQLYSTEFKVLSEIHKAVFGNDMKITGRSSDELYHNIMNHLLKNEEVLVIGLDDFNFMKGLNDTLYRLLRAHESYRGVQVGICAITSEVNEIKLKPIVSTVFLPVEINFPKYDIDQIYDILKKRCDIGFYPGVIKEEVLDRVVQLTYKNGDLRYGIDLLKSIGEIAETDGSSKILVRHFSKAMNN